MQAELRRVALLGALIGTAVAPARGQSANDGRLLGARRVTGSPAFKIWVPAGQLRLVAWDRDSLVARGFVARGQRFFLSGDSAGMKLGTEGDAPPGTARQSAIVIYLPRHSKVSVKSVTASIDATGVSGWFYSVSGAIHLAGTATSIEAESMTGNLDLDVTTPWMHARTGDGHLLVRGAPEDVDASTIAGTLDIAATAIRRGQFGTVSGDLHYVGSPARNGIFDFNSHSGTIDLLLPESVSGTFSLSSMEGRIDNGFASVRPTAQTRRTVRLSLGRGEAQVAVRTFKGTIRLRPQ